MNEILLFYVTHPDVEHANKLCGQLITEKLIACSNILPITSEYVWNNQRWHHDEVVSILKTRLELEDELEKRIESLHTYDLPCIIRYRVNCNTSYAKWVEEMTTQINK